MASHGHRRRGGRHKRGLTPYDEVVDADPVVRHVIEKMDADYERAKERREKPPHWQKRPVTIRKFSWE